MGTFVDVDGEAHPGKRGIDTYGAIIRQQRLARNYSQERLAAEAGCDPRVIAKAEKGGPISLKKLHKIGKALHVDFGLIANINPGQPPPNTLQCDVFIKITIPSDEFKRDKDQAAADFAKCLREALAPFNDLRIKSVRVGSVIINLEMSLAALNAICIAQEAGVLDALEISSISLANYLYWQPVVIRGDTYFDVKSVRHREVEEFVNRPEDFRAITFLNPYAGMPDSVIRKLSALRRGDPDQDAK